MSSIQILENFISEHEFNTVLRIAKSTSEEDWSIYNEEALNGKFWNGKRLMISVESTKDLYQQIKNVWQSEDITAVNKLQRFFNSEHLGPLVDAEHANIKSAMIIFLNDDFHGGGIEFPQDGIIIEPSARTAVIYDGTTEYKILASDGSDPMYFITVFLNEERDSVGNPS